MRITELFDGNKKWDWTYQDKNQAMAKFAVGDLHYTFSAMQDPEEAPGDWDIEFAAKQHGTSSWGVTGTGNSAEVFGTVVDIMKSFIESKKSSIRRMTFAAKEDSRQGLYARMVKRLLPKWNLEQNGEAFVLTRPGGLVFWVYSVEAPYNKIPPVKVKANSAKEAEQIVLTTMPEFKGADLMGMGASKNKPDLSENFAEEFTNYQGLRPPKNVPGTNLFPGQDIVGQRVYHCTNRLEAIKKSGGLKPRRDDTGEREYGRLSTDEHPFIPVIGIWFNVGKPDWPGKHCVSFVIEPTDQVYVAYASIKGLKPNVVLNPIALDRLTIEGQQDVKENFADGRNPQDKGDSKRHGINTKASVSSLRKTAKQGGRKGQLAHWLANMKAGHKK